MLAKQAHVAVRAEDEAIYALAHERGIKLSSFVAKKLREELSIDDKAVPVHDVQEQIGNFRKADSNFPAFERELVAVILDTRGNHKFKDLGIETGQDPVLFAETYLKRMRKLSNVPIFVSPLEIVEHYKEMVKPVLENYITVFSSAFDMMNKTLSEREFLKAEDVHTDKEAEQYIKETKHSMQESERIFKARRLEVATEILQQGRIQSISKE